MDADPEVARTTRQGTVAGGGRLGQGQRRIPAPSSLCGWPCPSWRAAPWWSPPPGPAGEQHPRAQAPWLPQEDPGGLQQLAERLARILYLTETPGARGTALNTIASRRPNAWARVGRRWPRSSGVC